MSYSKRVISTVNDIFERRREHAFSTLTKRKEELIAKSDEINALNRELAALPAVVIRATAEGVDVASQIQNIKKKSRELRMKRSEKLVELGYPLNYLDLLFNCEKCEDNGYIGSEMCVCYKNELIRQAYSQSVLAGAVPEASFKAFSLEYYSDVPDESGVSPRDRMKMNLNVCKGFAKKFDKQSKSLLLSGGTGLGKTFLSGCISKELVERGVDVVYETAHNVFATLEREKFSSSEETRREAERFLSADLLIIDDLGTEFISSFTVAALYNLINTRILKKKLMIISTNCEMRELERLYTSRIASRLVGEFTLLEFVGDDIRFIKGMK